MKKRKQKKARLLSSFRNLLKSCDFGMRCETLWSVLRSPSQELLTFIRTFHNLFIQEEELKQRFEITRSLYPLLHSSFLADTCKIPHSTPPFLLGEIHAYLGSMGALFYFHENKETARENGKRIGGMSKALTCHLSLLKEDLNVIRKQEGTDAVTRIYKLELYKLEKEKEKEKTRNVVSSKQNVSGLPPSPAFSSVAIPVTSDHKIFCQKCFSATGRMLTNHTTMECKRK